jgi:hypothetical protein
VIFLAGSFHDLRDEVVETFLEATQRPLLEEGGLDLESFVGQGPLIHETSKVLYPVLCPSWPVFVVTWRRGTGGDGGRRLLKCSQVGPPRSFLRVAAKNAG